MNKEPCSQLNIGNYKIRKDQGLGTRCSSLGQPMPKGWGHDAQGLGNLA